MPKPATALPADAAGLTGTDFAAGSPSVAELAAAAISPAPGSTPGQAQESAQESGQESAPPGVSARELLDRAQQAMKRDDFIAAKAAWAELHKLNPSDNYFAQQLALATYKARLPSADQALADARRILDTLSPATTNDPETLGLWGAVHKRVWDLHHDPEALAEAIGGYERGFLLKQDHYNGINLAFVLNVRAVESARRGERDEAGADKVLAQRVRRDVIRYVLPKVESGEDDPDDDLNELEGEGLESAKRDGRVSAEERRYWVIASLWEAALGLGDSAGVARWEAEARKLNVPTWMHETREQQGEKLLALQKELEGLLSADRA